MTNHPLVIVKYEWGSSPTWVVSETIPHAMLWSTIQMLYNESRAENKRLKILAVLDARTDTVII